MLALEFIQSRFYCNDFNFESWYFFLFEWFLVAAAQEYLTISNELSERIDFVMGHDFSIRNVTWLIHWSYAEVFWNEALISSFPFFEMRLICPVELMTCTPEDEEDRTCFCVKHFDCNCCGKFFCKIIPQHIICFPTAIIYMITGKSMPFMMRGRDPEIEDGCCGILEIIRNLSHSHKFIENYHSWKAIG